MHVSEYPRFLKKHLFDFISIRDKCFLVLFAFCILVDCLLRLFNQAVLHYTILQHKHLPMMRIAIVLAVYYFLGVVVENLFYSRIGLFLQAITKNLALYIHSYYGAIFLLTTPFPLADHLLMSWDRGLGFHTLPVMEWFSQSLFIDSILRVAYIAWGFELMFLPCIWAALNKKLVLEQFYLAWIICVMMGAAMYYVLPANGPASIVQTPLFSSYDKVFSTQFFDVHHHILMNIQSFGIITIPSFHVIAALLIMYYTRNDKYFFYPLLALNLLMIVSTLALGMHYLVDVIASCVIAPVAIYLSNACGTYIFAVKSQPNTT